MPVEWAGLGPDLLLRLDRERAEPLRVQLEEQLRDAIRVGRIAAGERLPSSRVLARELGVSRGLVMECYAQLESEGYLSTRGGSATRVAPAHWGAGSGLDRPAPSRPTPRLGGRLPARVPDLTSFPRADWLWALREAARRAPNSAFGYGDPRGQRSSGRSSPPICAGSRGAVADPEHVVICSGFAQGVHLVLRALVNAGLRVSASRIPVQAETRRCPEGRAQVAPVPVDAGVVVVDELVRTAAGAVIVTPAHQTPTRRRAGTRAPPGPGRLGLPNRRDDHRGRLRRRVPVRPRAGRRHAGPRPGARGVTRHGEQVAGPALRLGWIVCPPRYRGDRQEKLLADQGSPGLDQLALAC